MNHHIETARTWKSEGDGAKERTHAKDGSNNVNKKMWRMMDAIYKWIDDEKHHSLDESKNF